MLAPRPLVLSLASFLLSTTAFAQLQVNQGFLLQGPSPSIGIPGLVQSADFTPAAALGSNAGAIGPIVTDPVNANTYYVGAVNGGVWKTTDGGNSWTPLTNKQASLSIASLSLDPTDATHNTLIAGTGLTSNGTACPGSACFFSGSGGLQNGLLYSRDGGASWSPLGVATFAGQSVVGVQARGNTIVAGTFEISGLGGDKNAGGLFRSTNGGATFTVISGAAGTGLPAGPVSSIVGDPTNANRLFAAVTAPNTGANASTAIYVSNDAGATWASVFSAANAGTLIQSNSQTVVRLATGPGGSVAAGIVDLTTKTVTGLFWSGNSGGTWTQLPAPTLNNGAQAPVNFAIAIDPTNKNLVYVSGDRINNSPFTATAFRIDASALTMTSITDANTANQSSLHADTRAIAFDASGRLLLSSDGGIYGRTNPQNDTGAWVRLNNGITAFQTNNVGYDAIGGLLITAAQDSGVTTQAAANSPVWVTRIGGDGINAFVNDVTLKAAGMTAFYGAAQSLGNPSRLVIDTQGKLIGSASVTCNGTLCGPDANGNAGAVIGAHFFSPWVNNKIDPTRTAIAGSHVYVTQDTLTGAQAPASSVLNLALTDIGDTGGSVFLIAYGTRDNPNVLLAGANSGLFLSTTSAASSLAGLPSYAGATPTGLVFDPRSQNRFYVADNSQLFGTTTQGASFSNLTSNLPSSIIRPNAVEFISNNGVNALLTGGINNVANAQSTIAVANSDAVGNLTNWRPFGTGLPNTQVTALTYNLAADVLAVGTFGSGVFALYDVTSYFPQATVLRFGLADNDSPSGCLVSDRRNGWQAGAGKIRDWRFDHRRQCDLHRPHHDFRRHPECERLDRIPGYSQLDRNAQWHRHGWRGASEWRRHLGAWPAEAHSPQWHWHAHCKRQCGLYRRRVRQHLPGRAGSDCWRPGESDRLGDSCRRRGVPVPNLRSANHIYDLDGLRRSKRNVC
jgi:hypothetical protein